MTLREEAEIRFARVREIERQIAELREQAEQIDAQARELLAEAERAERGQS